MSKNIFHITKRSEYRNNYLPFDYYDFMITAKENENLRFRNKIRDYLHTPFDWDEDQDFYIEQESEKFRNMNQATQTAVKPRHGHHHQYSDAQLKVKPSIKHHDNYNNNNNNNQTPQQFNNNNQTPQQFNNNNQTPQQNNNNNQTNQQNNNNNNNHSSNNKKNQARQSKTASFQINTDRMEQNNPNPSGNHQKRSNSKSGRKNKNKAQNQNNQNEFLKSHIDNSNHTNEKKSNNNGRKIDFKSISNMAVQTPLAWNLRDYNKTKPKRPLSRSASASNLQPRRVPFANYGWATKTKDLSLKPTHNALANKTLAKHFNDRDAIVELTLHKLKRDAVHVANEYSAVESAVADQFHNYRSESRAWNSEYDEKYPDYSRSSSRNELYFTPNPNRLSKSTLVTDHPQLRRGPKSAKVKIFYNES